ncbi:transcriptional regulator [Streptomyces sp. BE20]|uniref:transcriptional regulator n=1 Tax=Streptomyces sp. BE20 TaxID=3002525 RepID=UPI002E7783A9|nr:transcriptional regulator [Streptomyces sp. BE20]MEE1823172.1 transcriptional regulator [Streptomyces sp. BE20]
MAAPFDPLLQHPTRLTVLAFLSACAEAEFGTVRDHCEVSDSVLSKAATALEQAGYLKVRKGAVGRRPRTWLVATRAGRRALTEHLAELQRLVAAAEAAGAATAATVPADTVPADTVPAPTDAAPTDVTPATS